MSLLLMSDQDTLLTDCLEDNVLFLCFVFNHVCIQICSSDYACLERMAEESKFGQSGTKPSDVSARV